MNDTQNYSTQHKMASHNAVPWGTMLPRVLCGLSYLYVIMYTMLLLHTFVHKYFHKYDPISPSITQILNCIFAPYASS